MGHVGLTPQGVSVLGGFRAQGRTCEGTPFLDDALALEKAGAFAVVVECVPAEVASVLTTSLEVSVIGIGALGQTNGQVLVYHDLLGIQAHPHFEKHVPSFCKKYAELGISVHQALTKYREETKQGIFPGKAFSPYKMSAEESRKFAHLVELDAKERSKRA